MAHSTRVRSHIDPILAEVGSVWSHITSVLDGLVAQPDLARRAYLRTWSTNAKHDLDLLQAKIKSWTEQELQDLYDTGTDEAGGGEGNLDQSLAVATLAYISAQVMEPVMREIRAAKSQIDMFVRWVAQDPVLSEPGTAKADRLAALESLIERTGLNSVLHSNGNRHPLGDYLQMLIDTNGAIATFAGRINAYPSVSEWTVEDGPDCGWTSHDDPDPANGKTVSRDEAMAWPLSHPRCQRVVSPVIP